MIKILLGNTSCKLIGSLPPSILKEMDSEMSYKFPGYQYMKSNRYGGKHGWDGRFRLFSKSKTFPIGLLSRAKDIFDKNNISYTIVDKRPDISYGNKVKISNKKFIPRDYQKRIVKKCFDSSSGIVRVATGGGKTAMIAMLTAKYNVKTIIYVVGIELLYQMKSTIENLYGLECGIVGGGKCELNKDVTIMTIWSAAAAFNKKCKLIDSDVTSDKASLNKSLKKEEVRKKVNEAELIMIDECQYAASETVQFLHKESHSARHRFLFSGTPWRDGGDDILIEAVGGPKIYDLNATKLIRKDYLVPPEIHFINVPPLRGVGKTYQEVYKNYIVDNPERNELIIKCARKLIKSGKKVLILVVRVSHGNALLEMIGEEFRAEFLDGKKNANQRLQSIKDMKQGGLDILIASKIFDQGIDIPELDALILAGSGKSSGRALQRIGRVIRKNPGKKKAVVVEFFDNAKYLRDHSEKRIEVYKSEPGFKIIMPKNKVLHKYPKPKSVKWT